MIPPTTLPGSGWEGKVPVLFTASMTFLPSTVDQGTDTTAFQEAFILAAARSCQPGSPLPMLPSFIHCILELETAHNSGVLGNTVDSSAPKVLFPP